MGWVLAPTVVDFFVLCSGKSVFADSVGVSESIICFNNQSN